MTDMVERIARAIYARSETYPRYALMQMNGLLADDFARAALEAMREPTEEMLKDGWLEEGVENIWQSMIDAALKPPRSP